MAKVLNPPVDIFDGGFNLAEILPPSIRDDVDARALALAADAELKSVGHEIKQVLLLSRLDELPENVVDSLAWQYHVDFYEQGLSLEQKRNLVRDSILWHSQKGTKWAVRKVLENLGLKCNIKEWFETGGKPYTFGLEIVYPADPAKTFVFLGKDTIEKIKNAVNEAKPVRATLEYIVGVSPEEIEEPDEPQPPEPTKHECRHDFCTWGHILYDAIKDARRNELHVTENAKAHFSATRKISDSMVIIRELVHDVSRWGDDPYVAPPSIHTTRRAYLPVEKLNVKQTLSEFNDIAETVAVFDWTAFDGQPVMSPRWRKVQAIGVYGAGATFDALLPENGYVPVIHFGSGGDAVFDLSGHRESARVQHSLTKRTELVVGKYKDFKCFGEFDAHKHDFDGKITAFPAGKVLSTCLDWKQPEQHTWETIETWDTDLTWNATQ